MSATIPGSGNVADPGFVVVIPGNGLIRIAPVSVCHQVSTMGAFSWPMLRWYHSHASGLIGSQTEPRTRSEDRSWRAGYFSPCFMNERMAVGAQYRIVTLRSSTICHQRSQSGVSGAPSYITPVVAFASGP